MTDKGLKEWNLLEANPSFLKIPLSRLRTHQETLSCHSPTNLQIMPIRDADYYTNSKLRSIHTIQQERTEMSAEEEFTENESIAKSDNTNFIDNVSMLKDQLMSKLDTICNLEGELVKSHSILIDSKAKMLSLVNDNKSLYAENQKLKTALTEWADWYKRTKQNLSNFPPLEELEAKDNARRKKLTNPQKKLKAAYRIISSLNKSKIELEKKLYDNIKHDSSDCCSYCCPKKNGESSASRTICAGTDSKSSCNETETQESTKFLKSTSDLNSIEDKSTYDETEEQTSETREIINSDQLTTSTKVESIDKLKTIIIKTIKKKGLTKLDYCKELTKEKIQSLAKWKKFGSKEYLLESKIQHYREVFCQIQDSIVKLRNEDHVKNSSKLVEKIEKQKTLANAISNIEIELSECSDKRNTLYKSFKHLEKMLQFLDQIDF